MICLLSNLKDSGENLDILSVGCLLYNLKDLCEIWIY